MLIHKIIGRKASKKYLPDQIYKRKNMIERKLDNCLALETNSIKECILYLEKSTKQIIFVVNKNKTTWLPNRWRFEKSNIKKL